MPNALARLARTLAFALALAALLPVRAQIASAPAPAPSPSAVPYASVAEALKALEAQDGVGTIVTHSDGWTIVGEPGAAAQWSFTPSGYYAYPAVVRRVIRHAPDGDVSVEIGSLCESSKESCARLIVEFEQFNDRIRQSVKARQRQTPPRQ